MSFQTQLAAEKTAYNTQVTSQTGANTVVNSVYGVTVEAFMQTIINLGLDGDLATFVSLANKFFKVYSTTPGTAYNTLSNISHVFYNAAGLQRVIVSADGTAIFGDLTGLKVEIDSTGNLLIKNNAVVGIKLVNGVDSYIKLRDGADNLYYELHATPFAGLLSADRKIYPIDATGNAPIVVLHDRQPGLIAAYAGSAFTCPAADSSFEVSLNILVTISTTHSFSALITYKDEGGTTRNQVVSFTQLAGTTTTTIDNAAGAVPYAGQIQHLRCKGGTTITVSTTGTFTTVTYNFDAVIKQTTNT